MARFYFLQKCLSVGFGEIQRVDLKLFQLGHDLLGEETERGEGLFLSQLTEGKFTEKGVGAGFVGDSFDLF